MSTLKSLFAILPVLILVCVLPSSAQHFQQIQGATLTQVAAGGASVWGVDSSGNVFRFNTSTQTFDQIPGTLFTIGVGGGNFMRPDEVWGLDRSGQVFRFNPTTQTFDQMPGAATALSVGPGYSQCSPYEVWGLHNTNYMNKVIRYDFCTSTFQPAKKPSVSFTSVSVGQNEVWATDYQEGGYRYDATHNTFFKVSLTSIYRVIAGSDEIYGMFDGGQTAYFVGGGANEFYKLPLVAKAIAAGGDGVWAMDSTNQVYRLIYSIPSFELMPGSLSQISVGYGTGVWGINTAGQVFVFETP